MLDQTLSRFLNEKCLIISVLSETRKLSIEAAFELRMPLSSRLKPENSEISVN